MNYERGFVLCFNCILCRNGRQTDTSIAKCKMLPTNKIIISFMWPMEFVNVIFNVFLCKLNLNFKFLFYLSHYCYIGKIIIVGAVAKGLALCAAAVHPFFSYIFLH